MTIQKTKVVLYDPKIFFRALIADILEREGYEVITCETLKTFINGINEFSPPLVLIDVFELGDRDVEFLTALKKSYPNLSIISLVDADKKELIVRYVKAGVFDYVSKPIIKEELLLAVKKAEEFYYYKSEENSRLGKLKRFVYGSEKIIHLVKKSNVPFPFAYPGDNLIQSILDATALVLDAEKVSISWISADKKSYQVVASAGHNLDVSAFKPRLIGEGIVGYVAHNKETIYVKNIFTDSRFKASSFKEQYKSGSFLCGPIVISGDVLAVLSVSDRKDGKAFSEEDFFLFKTFLMQTTYAIETSLMIKVLETNQTKFKVYKDIVAHISNLVETTEIIKSILKTIAYYFQSEGVALYILDENKEFFVNEGSVGGFFKEKVTFFPVLKMFLDREITDKDKDALKAVKIFIKEEKVKNFYTSMIKLKNYPLGFIVIVNYTKELPDETTLEDIASLVSIAFKNNWLYKKLCDVTNELVETHKELEKLLKKG